MVWYMDTQRRSRLWMLNLHDPSPVPGSPFPPLESPPSPQHVSLVSMQLDRPGMISATLSEHRSRAIDHDGSGEKTFLVETEPSQKNVQCVDVGSQCTQSDVQPDSQKFVEFDRIILYSDEPELETISISSSHQENLNQKDMEAIFGHHNVGVA